MSGWENVPEEAPKQPAAPRKRRTIAATAPEIAATPGDQSVDDSELTTFIESYWPHAWLMMLIAVCMIGIWRAVGHLPNHPSWWP